MMVFILAGNENTKTYVQSALEQEGLEVGEEKPFFDLQWEQEKNSQKVHLIQSLNTESLIWPEKGLIF